MEWAEIVSGVTVTLDFKYIPGFIRDQLQYLARCNSPDPIDAQPPYLTVRLNGSAWREAYIADMQFGLDGQCNALRLRIPGQPAGLGQREFFFCLIREFGEWRVSTIMYKVAGVMYDRHRLEGFAVMK